MSNAAPPFRGLASGVCGAWWLVVGGFFAAVNDEAQQSSGGTWQQSTISAGLSNSSQASMRPVHLFVGLPPS